MSLISQLASKARLTKSDTQFLVKDAPRRYKIFTIPKRGTGFRTIAQPAREVKTLQRALMELAPSDLAVHGASTAYEKQCSIHRNAEIHSASNWVARLDFSNFFNSITSENWRLFLSSASVDEEFINLSETVFFWQSRGSNNTCLSVGAPSSPFASNRIMYCFDRTFAEVCAERNLLYTRYADDLTVSGAERFDLEELSRQVQSSFPEYLSLRLNTGKTRISGPGQRRVVTGLIISSDQKITIGKKKRKLLEARLHRYVDGACDLTAEQIRGHLDFLRSIEPVAYEKLKHKFAASARELFKNE